MPWIFISSPIHGSSDTFLLQAWYILEFPETDTSDGCPASSFQFLNISWIFHQLSHGWMPCIFIAFTIYGVNSTDWYSRWIPYIFISCVMYGGSSMHGLIQLYLRFKLNIWWTFHRLIQRIDSLQFPFMSNIWWIYHTLIQRMDALLPVVSTILCFNFGDPLMRSQYIEFQGA